MNKDEARSSVMGAISMALKDPTLQQGFEIICKNLSELEKENAELRRDKEDLIFIRDQKAKCMCAKCMCDDKERFTKAKAIIRDLLSLLYSVEYDRVSDLEEAEQFLKETTDIREDSTLDGDWVVDEH